MWNDQDTSSYFDILNKYSEKIIIEVAAHDHFSDLRYHENKHPSKEVPSISHNLIVSPGITPMKSQNPGFAVLDVDEVTQIPQNYKLTFVELEKTYG